MRRKDWEGKGGDTTQELARGRGRGCVLGERIEDVGLHGLRAQDDAGGKDGDPNVCEYPIRLQLTGPSIPKQSNGDEQAAGDHHGHAVFRSGDAAGLVFQVGPDTVGDPCSNLRGHCVANGEGDIVEAGLRDRLAVALSPQLGESGEHDVVDSEVVSHEDGHNLKRWLSEQESHWPRQGNSEFLPKILG